MQFNSLEFAGFFLSALILFYIMPKRVRWMILLMASGCFYWISGPKNAIYLSVTIVSTYLIAIGIGQVYACQKKALLVQDISRDDKKKIKAFYKRYRKALVTLCIVLNLGLLCYLKYINFFSLNISNTLTHLGVQNNFVLRQLILPLGVSFYTFQTLGYIIDVFRGKYEPEKNLFKFALFVSFFPHIIQGPIAKYDKLAPQFFEKKNFDYQQISYGFQLIIWGLFKKLVIADRLNIPVSQVYNNWSEYHGAELMAATVLFSIQIYADFSGYMDIATGVAETFGIHLEKNFNHPYFSKTMPEFWRRWHITLGIWFKDYVYYPISVSKFSQNLNRNARKYFGNGVGRIIAGSLPIFVVWIATGIWHGAEWKYVLWGLFHGMLIILSLIFSPLNNNISKKLRIPIHSFPFRLYQMLRTFILCCIGRIFFRSASIGVAFQIMKKGITDIDVASLFKMQTYINMGLDEKDWQVVVVSIVILWGVSVLQEKWKVRDMIAHRCILIRWVIFYVAIFAIVIYGIYGPGYDASSFIYNQF